MESRNLELDAKDEFVEIFMNSKSVSTSKGKTDFLVRKPRSRVKEVKQFDREERKALEDEELLLLKDKIDELSVKIQDYEQKEESFRNKQSLARLYDLGVVNLDREYVE